MPVANPLKPAEAEAAGGPAKTARPKKASKKDAKPAVRLEDKFARLGLRRDMDFVLHLPMRYEDETQVTSMRDAGFRGGSMVQVEGLVMECDIQYRPRRQLVVTIADDTSQVVMRFLNFYGSQTTQLAVGTRVRARGELRHGFFGAEMVHPGYKIVN
ncbi:OB-fold nucleic acid binding domain-containing protein, partial [Undibacterium sp.]|uniref:OB-fold nucleic acid binding domain-containing protein n=1 Tax=Undibacterium sp. TaxID=1914977 RepID=UPI00374D5A83